MANCTECGHELGRALFCTQCGRPAGSAPEDPGPAATVVRSGAGGDTAERPAITVSGGPVPPAPGAPVPEPPSNARFPMYADEVETAATQVREVTAEHPPPEHQTDLLPNESILPFGADDRDGRPSRWLIWTLAAALLVAALALGGWLMLRGSDDPAASSGEGPSGQSTDSTGPGDPGDPGSGKVRDVAGSAAAEVPAVAAPNQDLAGRPVRYDAANMFDGDPTTTWRMPGDGTGDLITIRLAKRTELTEVGLINGYAKIVPGGKSGEVNWYLRNRRITRVEWGFDDGTVVLQRLTMTPTRQRLDVDHELTATVTLRLLDVSAPQPGRSGRNYTAISEVVLRGISG